MAEENASASESATLPAPNSVSWVIAAILAVLALFGGVLLGRVAFVASDSPAPSLIEIDVLDTNLEVSGTVEYLPDHEVYLLTISTMPPPSEGEVFQVWMQTEDLIVRAGLLDPTSRDFAFAAYSGRYNTMFITAEPGPFGSEQPTSEELITVDLTELEIEED